MVRIKPALIFPPDGETFTSHAGEPLTWMFDALKIKYDFGTMMRDLNPKYQVAGIEFGGALMALAHTKRAILVRKSGQVYMDQYDWSHTKTVSLIDDVCTTETSFIEAAIALANVGIGVSDYSVILDRRDLDKQTLPINSLITVADCAPILENMGVLV